MNMEMELDLTDGETQTLRAIQAAEARVQRLLTNLSGMTIREEQMALSDTTDLSEEDRLNHDQEYAELQGNLVRITQALFSARNILDALSTEQKKRLNAEKEKAKEESLAMQTKQKAMIYFLKYRPASLNFNKDTSALQFMEGFIKYVGNCLESEKMKEDHLWDLLKVCIKDDERSSAFFTKLKGDKTPPNVIVALKTQFLDFYSGRTWQGSQLSQVSSLAMGKEQPSTYNSRLSTMCLSMGIKMDARGDQGFQLLKKTLFNRLPFVVQNTLQAKAKEVIENGTIQDYLD